MGDVVKFCKCETVQNEELKRARERLVETSRWAHDAQAWIRKCVAGNGSVTEASALLDRYDA